MSGKKNVFGLGKVMVLCAAMLCGCLSAKAAKPGRLATEASGACQEEAKRDSISLDNQLVVSYHEAAHAVMMVAVGFRVEKIRVFTRTYTENGRGVWGYTDWGTEQAKPAGPDGRKPVDPDIAKALVYLAGNAAEDVLFKKAPSLTDADADYAAVASLAYCEKASCTCPDENKIEGQCLMNGLIKTEHDAVYAAARRCVNANIKVVMHLAKLTMLQAVEQPASAHVLDRKALDLFFEKHPLNLAACTQTATVAPPAPLP